MTPFFAKMAKNGDSQKITFFDPLITSYIENSHKMAKKPPFLKDTLFFSPFFTDFWGIKKVSSLGVKNNRELNSKF